MADFQILPSATPMPDSSKWSTNLHHPTRGVFCLPHTTVWPNNSITAHPSPAQDQHIRWSRDRLLIYISAHLWTDDAFPVILGVSLHLASPRTSFCSIPFSQFHSPSCGIVYVRNHMTAPYQPSSNSVKINRLLICLPTIQGNEAEGFIRADTSVLRKCLYCVYTLGQKSSGIFF